MTDHVNAPAELMDPPACDCCGVPSTDRRTSIWHRPDWICHGCFHTWYETGLVNRKKLKAERLKRYGTRDVPAGEVL